MAGDNKGKQPKQTNWERAEIDWRAGILTTAEIARKHGTTKQYLNRKARAMGWTRDLSVRVRARAEALLSWQNFDSEDEEAKERTEEDAIKDGALAIVHVRRKHRDDIERARFILQGYVNELGSMKSIENVIRAEADDYETPVHLLVNRDQHLQDLMKRARVASELTRSMRTLIELERAAYDISDLPEDPHAKGVGISSSDPRDAAREYHRLMGP